MNIGKNLPHLPNNSSTKILAKENKQQGFTLIELVSVMVIIGILSATAIPRFLDLGQDARIASVKALEGTLRSTAGLLHMACILKPGCSATAGFFYLPYNNKTLLINNAYPEAGMSSVVIKLTS